MNLSNGFNIGNDLQGRSFSWAKQKCGQGDLGHLLPDEVVNGNKRLNNCINTCKFSNALFSL